MKNLVTVSALAIVLGFSANAFAKGGFQGPQAPMGEDIPVRQLLQ